MENQIPRLGYRKCYPNFKVLNEEVFVNLTKSSSLLKYFAQAAISSCVVACTIQSSFGQVELFNAGGVIIEHLDQWGDLTTYKEHQDRQLTTSLPTIQKVAFSLSDGLGSGTVYSTQLFFPSSSNSGQVIASLRISSSPEVRQIPGTDPPRYEISLPRAVSQSSIILNNPSGLITNFSSSVSNPDTLISVGFDQQLAYMNLTATWARSGNSVSGQSGEGFYALDFVQGGASPLGTFGNPYVTLPSGLDSVYEELAVKPEVITGAYIAMVNDPTLNAPVYLDASASNGNATFHASQINFRSFAIPSTLGIADTNYFLRFNDNEIPMQIGDSLDFTQYYNEGIKSFQLIGLDLGSGDSTRLIGEFDFVSNGFSYVSISPVPEPSSIIFALLCGCSIGIRRTRRVRNPNRE